MGYIKYELPATLGRIVDQGRRFLGVKVKRNRGRFVLYDIETKSLVETFGMSEFDFETVPFVDELSYAKAVGDNGAYFFIDYHLDEEGEPDGCSIEAYDKVTFQHMASIPAARIKSNWMEDCRVAEVAKLTEEDYLIVYYDQGWGENCVVEACCYNALSKVFFSLERLESEAAQWRNISFDRDSLMLQMDLFPEERHNLLASMDCWGTCRFQLSFDFRSLKAVGNTGDEMCIFSEKIAGAGKRVRVYELGVELHQGRKGFLGKEYAKLIDSATGNELIDLTSNRNQTEWYEVLPELELVVAGVENFKTEVQKISVFEKHAGRISRTDCFDADLMSYVYYDKNSQTLQIQSLDKTVFITSK